jgi:hypothetical protein
MVRTSASYQDGLKFVSRPGYICFLWLSSGSEIGFCVTTLSPTSVPIRHYLVLYCVYNTPEVALSSGFYAIIIYSNICANNISGKN